MYMHVHAFLTICMYTTLNTLIAVYNRIMDLTWFEVNQDLTYFYYWEKCLLLCNLLESIMDGAFCASALSICCKLEVMNIQKFGTQY